MLYVADFEDGTMGKVNASAYHSAWRFLRLDCRKPMLRVRLGGLRDLAYRTPEQIAEQRRSIGPAITLARSLGTGVAQEAA